MLHTILRLKYSVDMCHLHKDLFSLSLSPFHFFLPLLSLPFPSPSHLSTSPLSPSHRRTSSHAGKKLLMLAHDPAHFLLMLCPQMIQLLAMVQPEIRQLTSMLEDVRTKSVQ